MTSKLDTNNYISNNYVDDNVSRSKNLTLEIGLQQGKFSKYLPYVFTEQGIYMLMTVLKGDLATQQSKPLIRTTITEVADRQVYHPIVDALLLNPFLSLS